MRGVTAAVCMSMVIAAAAHADGMEGPAAPIAGPSAATSGWEYQFTPYGWLPWLSGNTTIAGRQFKVAANPAQILENTDFVWMSYMQAKNGPLTFFADVIYGDLSSSGSLVTSARLSSDVSGTVGAALSADYAFWTVEMGGMYEVMKWRSRAGLADSDTVLELLAGGRYWRQDLEVKLALAGTTNTGGLTVSGNTAIANSGGVDWIDPFIGARLRYAPAPGEVLIVRGDVGGFSVGSKFTWQVKATYNWYLGTYRNILFDGYLGYRALAVDYERGASTNRYVYDVLEQGPVVGVTGRF